MVKQNINISSTGFLLSRIIVAGMLFWALRIQPYSYYILLRWIVFGMAAFTAFKFFKSEAKPVIKVAGILIFTAITILFNPIMVVHLNNRDMWLVIDAVVAVLFLLSIPAARK